MRGRDRVARLQPLLNLLQSAVAKLPASTRKRLVAFWPNSDGYFARAVRFSALRSAAAKCGELVDVRSQVRLIEPGKMMLGSRVSVHPFCYVDGTGGLIIGDDVSIAHSASILTTEHTWANLNQAIRDQPLKLAPTVIGSDVWIGAGARVLGGLTVGDGSIVAAGAVVTRDVQPYSVVAGVPARVIRKRKAQL